MDQFSSITQELEKTAEANLKLQKLKYLSTTYAAGVLCVPAAEKRRHMVQWQIWHVQCFKSYARGEALKVDPSHRGLQRHETPVCCVTYEDLKRFARIE